MKRNFLRVLIGFGIALVVAFNTKTQEIKDSTAEVNRVNGIYVFTDCYPVKQYDVLGKVKSDFGMSGQYENVRTRLIRKVKNDYPQANGIIIYPNNNGSDRAEAIKFK